jgi:hypothetical protein
VVPVCGSRVDGVCMCNSFLACGEPLPLLPLYLDEGVLDSLTAAGANLNEDPIKVAANKRPHWDAIHKHLMDRYNTKDSDAALKRKFAMLSQKNVENMGAFAQAVKSRGTRPKM